MGTQYNRPTLVEAPKIVFPITLIHFEPPQEDNLSAKDKTAEFILSPMCPLVPLYVFGQFKWTLH